MSSLVRINESVIFASPKRLFFLQSPPFSSSTQKSRWILKEWYTAIDIEDRTILGCTGGNITNKTSAFVILLDDKRILLLWISHNLSDEPAPVSYSITSTYRKASGAAIINDILVISDRFGSVYSHNLVQLESDTTKHNDVFTPLNKAVTFTLAEPVTGRCTSITSLTAGLDGSIYFSDRDGIIVETMASGLHDIRHIWSTNHTYLEQILPWYPSGVLALGDYGVSWCSYSQKKLFSKLIIANDQLDSHTTPIASKCICMARRGLVAFVAILVMNVSSGKLNIVSLKISRIATNDKEISVESILTHDIGISIDWESDASTLGQASRNKIMLAYDIISLQDNTETASGDYEPLFLDSLGTLFCINNGSISIYSKILDEKILNEWTCADRVVMEHAHRQVKL